MEQNLVSACSAVYSYLDARAFMVVTSGTTWRNRWTIRGNTAPISFFPPQLLANTQSHTQTTRHLPLSSSGRCSDSKKCIPSLASLKCNHICKDPVVRHDEHLLSDVSLQDQLPSHHTSHERSPVCSHKRQGSENIFMCVCICVCKNAWCILCILFIYFFTYILCSIIKWSLWLIFLPQKTTLACG